MIFNHDFVATVTFTIIHFIYHWKAEKKMKKEKNEDATHEAYPCEKREANGLEQYYIFPIN